MAFSLNSRRMIHHQRLFLVRIMMGSAEIAKKSAGKRRSESHCSCRWSLKKRAALFFKGRQRARSRSHFRRHVVLRNLSKLEMSRGRTCHSGLLHLLGGHTRDKSASIFSIIGGGNPCDAESDIFGSIFVITRNRN
jgi:hypothetical protein